jgi:predicted GNAT superfamily acetyltransferase
MTDRLDPQAIAEAAADAAAAAEAAGVAIDEVAAPDELDELRATMGSIWGPEIVPPRNLLRGLALGGGCLLLARHDGRPVGFALGWLGWVDGVHLHSHQVGVLGAHRGTGVGWALKLAQRAQALANGVVEMRWTFDPMLRANATFNLRRLGAEVIAFHPHCYGDRVDAFNTGDRTDRVEVRWRLDRTPGAPAPVAGPDDEVIELPADYHTLRREYPAEAEAWRDLVGARLTAAFAEGALIAGLGEQGYVVRRGGAR